MQQGRICPRGASYYVWQEGDTLQTLASRFSTTVQAIQLLNSDIDFNTIGPGFEICMPSQSFTCISGQSYTVRAGDSLTSIAQRFGITLLELMERNPGAEDGLLVGQVLCVPEGTSSPSQPQTPSQPSQPSQPQQPIRPQQPSQPSEPSRPQQPTQPPQPVIRVCRAGYTAGTIRRGQTYADLLIANNVSYQAMRAANPSLSPSQMYAGRTYCAPPSGTRQACTSAYRSYTVLPGEDLATLSEKLGVSQGRLLMLNPTLLPTDFSEGNVICVP